ncbi:hypothetical protein HPP92_002046 [Vanilla planifolia]|uniref:Sodium channel modifier 1 zinc-finger domain-containing protein n=1 Tax=Vanilla planifolia TaxID=51239 RepID=A0A835S5P0_VANPL|nr:hypothetical protein HPP92_002046 [Vanilla planifolia]
MSVFGGDSWAREAQHRKRRVDDLMLSSASLKSTAPAPSHRKLSNGKFVCLVCPNNPIFDTALILSMHINSSRHISGETRMKEKELSRQEELHKRIALSGDIMPLKKLMNYQVQKKPLTEKTRRAIQELHCEMIQKNQFEDDSNSYIAEAESRNLCLYPNCPPSGHLLQESQPPAFAPNVVSQCNVELQKKHEKELKFTAAGWKRDCHGKWFRDENESRTRKLSAAITRILRTRDTNPQWEESLADVFHLGEDIAPVVALLPDPDMAIAFLSWARRRPYADMPHSASDSALLRLLALARRFEEAEVVLQTMMAEGKKPSNEALSMLVGSYARAGLEDQALKAYSSTKEHTGAVPDTSGCNSLLHLLVKRGNIETAGKVYDEMVKREGGADNFSTGIMVKGFCMHGRMKEARMLMKNRWGSCVPDVVFYNMLIDGYCRSGDVTSGCALLRKMCFKGFLPTVATYGAIINGFCRKGNFEKVKISERKLISTRTMPCIYQESKKIRMK